MTEPLNTPEWWAAFFEWDRMVQLEFVNEALMAEFKMKTNVAEDVAMDAMESWCEHKRMYDFTGRFTVQQLAVLWAAYDLSVRQTNPLVVEQRDVTDGRWRIPLTLSGYTIEAWDQQLGEAKALLEKKFPWIAGWRLIALDPVKDPPDTRFADTPGIGKN